MAIVVDAVTTYTTATTQTTHSWSHTCGGSDRYLIVAIRRSAGIGQVTAATYAGQALTRLSPGSSTAGELWGRVNPASGANTISFTIANARQLSGVAMSLAGVHQATPAGTLDSNTANSTSPASTVSSATDELVVDGVFYANATSATPGAGQTLRGLIPSGSPNVRVGMSTKPGASSVSMGWTLGTSTNWLHEAIPLRPAPTAITLALAGGIAGTSSLGGDLSMEAAPSVLDLAGDVGGASAAAGALAMAAGLAGDVTGASAISGALGVRVALSLSGATTGESAVAGGMRLAATVIGSVAGTSTVTGSLETATALALTGAFSGTSGLAGALGQAATLAGGVAGNATATGGLALRLPLGGAVAGASTLTGGMVLLVTLDGALVGVSGVTGDLTGTPLGPVPRLGGIAVTPGGERLMAWVAPGAERVAVAASAVSERLAVATVPGPEPIAANLQGDDPWSA